jgi:hypothetical protein
MRGGFEREPVHDQGDYNAGMHQLNVRYFSDYNDLGCSRRTIFWPPAAISMVVLAERGGEHTIPRGRT